MPFQIQALSPSTFQHLYSLLSDTRASDLLAGHQAIRTTVTEQPGFPCRISLEDANVGEEILLVHYEHQSAATPFRASHAVYIRPKAAQAQLQINEVPAMLRSRLLSIRGFGGDGMLKAADVVEGEKLESCIEELFRNVSVAYLHIHFAKPGCYAACVHRA